MTKAAASEEPEGGKQGKACPELIAKGMPVFEVGLRGIGMVYKGFPIWLIPISYATRTLSHFPTFTIVN